MPKKILFIHLEKKQKYGSHYINELIIQKLRKNKFNVDTIYPEESLEYFSNSLSGIKNILFFYSMILNRKKTNKYDLIQGTTYTTLPFLGTSVPIISHFGSTTYGFLKKVPSAKKLVVEDDSLSDIFLDLKRMLVINGGSSSLKALNDIHKIEIHVAKQSDAVIATSEKVKLELIANRVPESKVHVIYNSIEDYWFKYKGKKKAKNIANLIYIGRMGDDSFTVRLKGINRLYYVLKKFSSLDKRIFGMCRKVSGYTNFFEKIPKTEINLSVEKKRIPKMLEKSFGDIYINTGRYEGFCLSLVEAMSQGLVPITFSIGVAPEIIVNGKNGYVVHNLSEMVAKINYLKNNKKKRQEMALEAMNASREFTSDKMITKFIKLYKEVFAKKKNKKKAIRFAS